MFASCEFLLRETDMVCTHWHSCITWCVFLNAKPLWP